MGDLNEPQGIKFEPVPDADTSEIEVLLEGIDEIPKPAPEPQDPEFAGKTKEQLVEELRRQKADLASAQERDVERAALREVLNDLKEARARPQGAIPPQQSQESEEQFKERVNKSFYDDPYGTLMEFQVKKLAPEVQRLMASNVQLSRKLATLDPERGATFKRYSAEIDDYVNQLPPQAKLYDADVYTKAHDAVIARHVNEIVDAKVQEALKTKQAPTASQPVHTEVGRQGGPPPQGERQRVILSEKERAYIQKQGISKEAYAAYVLRHPDKRIK